MPRKDSALGADANLVLVFGATDLLGEPAIVSDIQGAYPNAHIIGCSTAGEILGARVFDDTIVVTGIQFEKTNLAVAHARVDEHASSQEAGQALAQKLTRPGLAHVMVLSDGQHVNGSRLVEGLTSVLPADVRVTGGLAGDGARFARTLVWDERGPCENVITAVGFYGDHLEIGYGSLGGWDPFGPERLVTRSHGNVLAELDGRPALALYKEYLGEHAAALPASGLRFPLSVRTPEGHSFVRTILAVDEATQSLTFAGDVPENAYARLMKANFDRLVDGAQGAARRSHPDASRTGPDLAVLISCVGRKLLLGQRTEEEVEAVRDVLGPRARLTGFYSYGEICPAAPQADCELHNQTMTITTFLER